MHKVDVGYASQLLITDSEKERAVFENAYVLLTDHVIDNFRDVLVVVEEAAKHGRPLLVLARGFDGDVLPSLVTNHMRGIVKACAIALGTAKVEPGSDPDDALRAVLAGVTEATGGRVVSKELGMELKNTQASDLGQAAHVVVTEKVTLLSNDPIPEEDIPPVMTADEIAARDRTMAEIEAKVRAEFEAKQGTEGPGLG
ncbi:hypothetical protein [Kitasatospora sp. NPDC006786]|uniref:hypothetical protein n=1 Tax=unclassified Kitasatospora TaxID=2633591 RepID=UPI00340AC14C